MENSKDAEIRQLKNEIKLLRDAEVRLLDIIEQMDDAIKRLKDRPK